MRGASRAFIGQFGGVLVCVMYCVVSMPVLRAQEDSVAVWVRQVFVRGNEVTREEVILREMDLRTGSPLTDGALDRDRERIYNLQIFNRVDVTSHAVAESADVYVNVDERWYLYPFPVFGFRHHDLKKIYYGVGMTHQNVAGLNQKLFFEAATGYDRWVQLRFSNPRFLGSADYFFGVATSYSSLHPLGTDGSEYRQLRGILSMSLGKRFGFNQFVVGSLSLEHWDAPSGATRRTASATGKDTFLSAGVSFQDNEQYLKEYPMNGSFFAVGITKDGFGESEVDLLTASIDYRRYLPLGFGPSLALRGYGAIVTGGVIPDYRRIFYGYDERIRGSFLTSREGDGRMGGNAELRIPVLSPRYFESSRIPLPQFRLIRYGLYAGLFVDAGTIWKRYQAPGRRPIESGYGAGLHFILPYGATARLDVAFDRWGKSEIVIDGGASF